MAMCGRLSEGLTWHEIIELYDLTAAGGLPVRRSGEDDIYPAQDSIVIRQKDGIREAMLMHWSLVPGAKYATYNARVEGILERRSFKEAIRQRRCLIPVNSYYEWKGPRGRANRYRISMKNGAAFSIGGIWNESIKNRKPIISFALVTTTPNAELAPVHDRMPVIIAPGDFDAWLNGSVDDALGLAVAYPGAEMMAQNESPQLDLF
jgi:putative SOS response-associated peptidase YedK